MARSPETFFPTGGDPFEILGNPAPLYNYEMIVQFMDLYSKSRVIEETSSCDEFRKLVSEFEKKYSVSFSQLLSVKQAVKNMSLSVHNTISGLDPFVSMVLGDMMRQAGILDWKNQALQIGESSRQAGILDWKNQALQTGESSRQAGIRDWKNQALQIGESSRTLGQTIHGLDSFVFIDLGDMTRQGGIRGREGRNQAIQLGESRSILDNVVNTNEEVQRIAAASDIADPAVSEIKIDQLSQKETTESKRISPPKPVKLGKTFFPLNVQACLTLLTIFFTSERGEVKQLLQVAAAGNMVGYLAYLTEISLSKTNAKAANIMGRIGSTAAIFGFTIMMGSLLADKPAVSISVAAIVALVFFVVVAKM